MFYFQVNFFEQWLMFKENVTSIFITKTDEVITGNSPELWNPAIFMILDASTGGLQWIALKLSDKKIFQIQIGKKCFPAF